MEIGTHGGWTLRTRKTRQVSVPELRIKKGDGGKLQTKGYYSHSSCSEMAKQTSRMEAPAQGNRTNTAPNILGKEQNLKPNRSADL